MNFLQWTSALHRYFFTWFIDLLASGGCYSLCVYSLNLLQLHSSFWSWSELLLEHIQDLFFFFFGFWIFRDSSQGYCTCPLQFNHSILAFSFILPEPVSSGEKVILRAQAHIPASALEDPCDSILTNSIVFIINTSFLSFFTLSTIDYSDNYAKSCTFTCCLKD